MTNDELIAHIRTSIPLIGSVPWILVELQPRNTEAERHPALDDIPYQFQFVQNGDEEYSHYVVFETTNQETGEDQFLRIEYTYDDMGRLRLLDAYFCTKETKQIVVDVFNRI